MKYFLRLILLLMASCFLMGSALAINENWRKGVWAEVPSQEKEALRQAIAGIVDERITDGMTTYQKAFALENWIVENVEYGIPGDIDRDAGNRASDAILWKKSHCISDCVTSYDIKKIPEMLAYYTDKGCEVKSLAIYMGT